MEENQPKLILNLICRKLSLQFTKSADQLKAKDNFRSAWVMQMGQFIDHDLAHSPASGPNFPIKVDPSDPVLKQDIPFTRSQTTSNLECNLNREQEQTNQITHWLDGSNIYGSEIEEAHTLRKFQDGLMKEEGREIKGGLPPKCPFGKSHQQYQVESCFTVTADDLSNPQNFGAGKAKSLPKIDLLSWKVYQ